MLLILQKNFESTRFPLTIQKIKKENLCSHWERRFKNVNPGENPGVGSIFLSP